MSNVFGDLRQIAYVTSDLDRAMRTFVDLSGIGPWFVAEHIPMRNIRYRGSPLDLDVTIALANSGTFQIELIQQNSGEQSIYTEWLDLYPEGDVIHHLGSWSEVYDEVHAKALRLGHKAVQEGGTEQGRFVYFQHPHLPNSTFEVAELTKPRRLTFERVAQAAQDWDGRDPVREMQR